MQHYNVDRRVHKTITNNDVILYPYRTLPNSIDLTGVYKKKAVENLLSRDSSI